MHPEPADQHALMWLLLSLSTVHFLQGVSLLQAQTCLLVVLGTVCACAGGLSAVERILLCAVSSIMACMLPVVAEWRIPPGLDPFEALLITQALAAAVFRWSLMCVQAVLGTLHDGRTDERFGESDLSIVLLCLFGGLATVVMVCSACRSRGGNFACTPSSYFYGTVAFVVGLVEYPIMSVLLDKEPIFWVYNLIVSHTWNAVAFCWLGGTLILTLALSPKREVVTKSTWFQCLWPGATDSQANLLLRKFFHVAALVMFLPPLCWGTQDFMQLAFACAFKVLAILELCRSLRVNPQSWVFRIDSFMARYVDDRDRGPFILSHLYLIAGCALPVWMQRTSQPKTCARIVAGIAAVAAGDAAAALVGIGFACRGSAKTWDTVLRLVDPHRQSWPQCVERKSVQGTIAAIAAILGTTVISCGDISTTVIGASVMTACIETFTGSSDNIALPLWMWIMLE
jgi:dolichol kinase